MVHSNVSFRLNETLECGRERQREMTRRFSLLAGFVLGGMLVIDKGEEGIKYIHPEKSFGDYGPMEDMLKTAMALKR